MLSLKKSNIKSGKEIIFGDPEGNYLKLLIKKYVYPGKTDYWEANWIEVDFNIKSGAFMGTYTGRIKTSNLKDLKRGLDREKHYINQKGVCAYLESYENWIDVKITSNGKGGFMAECQACDDARKGNTLTFQIELSRDDILEIAEEVDEAIEAFPIKGKKS